MRASSTDTLIFLLSFSPYRFRWVFCQLEVLRHCLPASIRQTLKQLPKSLDDTYLRVIRQIPQANQALAHRMLQCLVVAIRPLCVEELAELLSFEFDEAPGGIPKYSPDLRLNDQTQAVLSTCSSLVTIVDDDSTWWYNRSQIVQFSHFSVKEFLVSNRLASLRGDISRFHICLGSAHTTFTQACLGLLVHSEDQITEESIKYSPLARYAAEHWVEHAQSEDVASRVKDGMETLFDPDRPHFEAWVEIYNIDPRVIVRDNWEDASPLYYSVLCGFYNLVERLAIKHPQYVNAFGGNYGFPLLAALCQGHVEVAELLLKQGADVDIREPTGNTILLVAFSWLFQHNNFLNTVEFLLTHGADVNARNDAFATSLHLAEDCGMQQLVTMLLKNKADVNFQDIDGKTPLHRLLGNKMYNDDSDHVRLLLEHGADVNRRDKDNQTPFLLAMKLGWFRAARILFEHGADPIVESNNGKSPWHLLSESWTCDEEEVLDLALSLWKFGAEVNRWDKNNGSPLHMAIRRNWFRLAGFLLEHGADANAVNNQGMTPFHVMLKSWINDEDDILDHVLHSAEVKRQDKDNVTPLRQAIRRSRFKLAAILLDHGADANAGNNKVMTPLHMLLESQVCDECDVLDHALLLIKHGAEVNRRDKDNETPLHGAIRRNRFKLANILLEHGADANAENDKGQTPLHILSESDIKDEADILNLAMLLLRHGTEVNRREKKNETPLYLAVRRNRFKLAEVLLEHCSDANVENDKGQTPLHLLSECDIKDEADVLNLALLLLRHGAEVNSRDQNNQTPLHLAIPPNRFELAGILLEHGADPDAQNNHGKTPLRTLTENWSYDKGDLCNHVQLLAHSMVLDRQQEGKKILLLPVTGEKRQSSQKLLLSLAAQILLWRTTRPISRWNKCHEGTTALGNVVLVSRHNHWHSNVAWTSKRKMRIKMKNK